MIVDGAIVDGRYRILQPLGGGAMGKVYLAEKVSTHERFAIKFIHDYLVSDDTYYARFEREINALRGIRHPHVVATYDWQLPPRGKGGNAYIVMEYLTGESMQQAIMRPQPMPVELLLRVMLQVLDGLGTVHSLGVIHRDLSPANIFLSGSDPQYPSTKIVDFGLAKGEAASSASDSQGGVTQDGAVLGRAAYAAPEMFLGRELDSRADIFACGMILYRTLAGRFPYRESRTELMWVERYSQRHEEGRPYPSARSFRSSIPPPLDQVISIALRKRPQERYQSAEQMLRDLLRVEEQLGFAAKIDGAAADDRGPALPDMDSIPDTTRVEVPPLEGPPLLPTDSASPTPRPSPVGEMRATPGAWVAEGSSRGTGQAPRWSLRHPRGRLAIAAAMLGIGVVTVVLALLLRGGGETVASPPGSRSAAAGTEGSAEGKDVPTVAAVERDARAASGEDETGGATTPDRSDAGADGGTVSAAPTEVVVTFDGMPAGAVGTIGEVKIEGGVARVARSEAPLPVKVTAEGFLDFAIDVTPTDDTVVMVFMDPEPSPDAGPAARPDAGAVVRRDAGSTTRRDTGATARRDAGATTSRDAGTTARRDTGTSGRREGGIGIITTYGP